MLDKQKPVCIDLCLSMLIFSELGQSVFSLFDGIENFRWIFYEDINELLQTCFTGVLYHWHIMLAEKFA